jgi:putative transposase
MCSIRKLFHPQFLQYESFIQGRFSNKEELLEFLELVKLREDRLKWALKQKNKTNKELATFCGIGIRRFLQLKAAYKTTQEVPKLNPHRRPKTFLTSEEEELIRKAQTISNLSSAVALRLYIKKYYDRLLPNGKIHTFLLRNGHSQEDPKKKKQRKYCRYEREHSFSLGHMDYHVSKVIPGTQVIVWIDDASRYILAGLECKEESTENAILVVEKAQERAWRQFRAVLAELNTDKGSQFYANKYTDKGKKGESKFEKYLSEKGIKHIPSKRNHPQTNGKNERWYRTYEEKRNLFDSFDELLEWYNNRIHLGLSRTEGITPSEAALSKLPVQSMIGLLFTKFN